MAFIMTNHFKLIQEDILPFGSKNFSLSNPKSRRDNLLINEYIKKFIKQSDNEVIIDVKETPNSNLATSRAFIDAKSILGDFLTRLNTEYEKDASSLADYALLIYFDDDESWEVNINYQIKIQHFIDFSNFINGKRFWDGQNTFELLFGEIGSMHLQNIEKQINWIYELKNMLLMHKNNDFFDFYKHKFNDFFDNTANYENVFLNENEKFSTLFSIISHFGDNFCTPYDFVGMVSIIELLLTHNPEYSRFNVEDSISKQFVLKSLFLLYLNDNNMDIKLYQKVLKEIYNIRSNIAHGNNVSIVDKGNSFANFLSRHNEIQFKYYSRDISHFFSSNLYYIVRVIIKEYIHHEDFVINIK